MARRLQRQIESRALKPAAEQAAQSGVRQLDTLARTARNFKTHREVRDSWLAARRVLRPLVLQHQAIDFDALIFATRHAPHHKELIFRDPMLCSVDMAPLKARPRPHIMPDTTSPDKNHATSIIPNIYEGMAKDNTARTIKYLRIAHHQPMPLGGC